METLILEDFRCFAGRNEVPIRPLTLLVGENSTGKTSFLAAVRAAHDLRSLEVPDFNEDPFRFGSYAQIANDGQGEANSFMIGQQLTPTQSDGPDEAICVEVRFHSSGAQPVIASLSASRGEYEIVYELEGDAHLSFRVAEAVVMRQALGTSFGGALPLPLLLAGGIQRLFIQGRSGSNEEQPLDADHEKRLDEMVADLARFTGPRPYAFAPIRTSPQRTHDPRTEVPSPEGRHIPMMLQRLLGNGAEPDFRERLEAFGDESGLYSSLGVRKLGQVDSDPFQIEVKLSGGGPARNLVDVGYGVSQAIPIIADCVSAEPGSALLIQQPEVHLHPRAQAAMGSFFAQLAQSERNRLVIETHSDYLLDRIRIDVREEKINCRDVVILYFEQDSHGVKIHPIELDGAGNLVGVPDGYRRFFLEEQRRFLGID